MKGTAFTIYAIILTMVMVSVGIMAVALKENIEGTEDTHTEKDIGTGELPFVPYQEGSNAVYSENYIETYGEPPEPEPEEEEIPVQEESFRWNKDPDMDSPEIYFHVNEDMLVDISVNIAGGVTKTIPEIPMDTEAEWNDVLVGPDGLILYNGQKYSMLYYEGIFVDSYGPSNMGWVVENVDGALYFEGVMVTENSLMHIFVNKMRSSGLKDNEIEFLIERVLEKEMLDFDSQYLLIRYIPQSSVDEAIQLEVPEIFSVMRRHFLLESTDEHIQLHDPEFNMVFDGNIIHETAVNRI